jgi:hypothetical protein
MVFQVFIILIELIAWEDAELKLTWYEIEEKFTI